MSNKKKSAKNERKKRIYNIIFVALGVVTIAVMVLGLFMFK
jgi:hypothetical protein